MNRREAGVALLGTLGALASGGCASIATSNAIPSDQMPLHAQAVPEGCTDLPIVLPERLDLRFGKSYLKTVGGPYTVTSSVPDRVKVKLTGDSLEIEAASISTQADISLVDAATGAKTTFKVSTGSF